MKIIKFIIPVFFLFACEGLNVEYGNGDMFTEVHQVSDFEEIEVYGAFKVYVEQSDVELVEVEADENLHEFIEVYTQGGSLIIDTDKNLRSDDGIRINVKFKELESITCAGASSVRAVNTIESDALDINLSGAGSLDMDIEAEDISVSMSGAGSMDLTGEAETLRVDMSGAGSIDAFGLEVVDADIGISGVGGAKVYVTGELDAQVSGVGGIIYRGDPERVQQDVSGLGKVKADDD